MSASLLIGFLAGAAAAVVWGRRLRGPNGTDVSVGLDDEAIRQIEAEGWIEVDEPIDLDHIRKEEARFWEESWDEPDEW